MLVKQFTLRDGAKATGLAAGDKVWLTQNQAQAWKDKFVAVDTSDFVEKKDLPPVESAQKKAADEKPADPKAPQGQPVVAPAVTVVIDDSKKPPVDPHSLDPARQGQQSNEQREIIDSGNAPLAKVFAEPAKSSAASQSTKPPPPSTTATETK